MSYAQTFHPGGGFQEDYWSSFSRNNFNNSRSRGGRNGSFKRNCIQGRNNYDFHDFSGNTLEQINGIHGLIHDGGSSLKRRKISASTWGECGGSFPPFNCSYDTAHSYFSNFTAVPKSDAGVSTSSAGSFLESLNLDGDDGEMLFMSRDEIERCSPSRKDGIDALREAQLRYSYCAFIQDLGVHLELPQTTIGTAMVLCHRFFLRKSHAYHDRFLVATAALFLAAKFEETPRPLNNVLRVSCETFHKQDISLLSYRLPIDWFEQYRERVLEAEQMILTTLNFELTVQHPYDPLTSVLNKLGLSHSVLVKLALYLISEGLRSSLWLQFKPKHIAAGAACAAAKMLNMDLALYHKIRQEFETTSATLQDVEQQLMELFQ